MKKCKCGKPVETRPGLEYPLCYDCWWAQDSRNEAKPAPPPASLEDEERARLWALERTHDKSWTFEMLYEGALWGLRTSRAEVLAEREKVRNLEEENKRLENALEKIRDLDYRGNRHQSAHIAFNELSGIHANRAAIRAMKKPE